MDNGRRHFIKTAGTGVVGLSVAPALDGVSSFWNPYASAFARATPESQGVSSEAIRKLVSEVNKTPGVSWHSFMLLRHNNVVAEAWWEPFEAQFVHSLYSLSKSFTSTAIGLLAHEGKLDINTKLSSFFPDDLPAHPSENLKQITVKHLLIMNSGHAKDTLPLMRASNNSWVRTYLSVPVEYVPGSHFLYNTGSTYMLGAILHKITGETLEQYLTPRLFRPLGIKGNDWETSPQQLNTAGYGLRVRTEDIARLGQLYLQKGVWGNKAILPAGWVEEATGFQTDSQVNNGDWSEGYGYQFWRCTHGAYRGDGAYGQFCIVMPELDTVLAITGQSKDMQKCLNLIWDNLLDGVKAGGLPANPSGHEMLKRELSELSLPVPDGSITSPLSSRYDKKKWTISSNDLGVENLRLDFSDKGCKLTAGKMTIGFGWGKWVVNKKRERYVFEKGDMFPMPSRIAGTATWVNDNTLQLNARFVEAIFGDKITCVFEGDNLSVTLLNSLAEDTFQAREDGRPVLQGKI